MLFQSVLSAPSLPQWPLKFEVPVVVAEQKRHPVASYAGAIIDNGQLWLRGFVATADGTEMVAGELRGDPAEDESLGRQLAENLRAQGAGAILEKLARCG